MQYVQMFYGDGTASSFSIPSPNYDAFDDELQAIIRDGIKGIAEITEECRRLYQAYLDGFADKNAYDRKKAYLPQALFQCLAVGRNVADVYCLSRTYPIDIDQKDNPDILVNNLRERLFTGDFVRGIYSTPSGTGLRVIVDLDIAKAGLHQCTDTHRMQVFSHQAHSTLKMYYQEKFGIVIDESCKNLNRVMYLSHDPEVQWKEPTSSFIVDTSIEVTIDDHHRETQERAFATRGGPRDRRMIAQIVEECERRDRSITSSYSEWLMVAMALKNTVGNEGFEYFDRLSRLDRTKYNEQDVSKKWADVHRTPVGGPPITIGTLILKAREAGIEVDTTTKDEERLSPKQIVREWLEGRYLFGRNEMNNMVYYKTPDDDRWLRFDWDFMPSEFLCTIESDRGLQTTMTNVEAVVRDMAAKHPYHPIREYLSSLVWDGTDRITTLCRSIKTDDDEMFRAYFVKWYLGMIACVMGEGANDKALILQGNQGDGKTFFFERLLPRQKGLKLTDVLDSFNPSDKDDKIKATEYMLIVFDEMSSYNKNALGELKSMITANEFEVRVPYGKSIVTRQKSATFAGCVNNEQFLRDVTGDRRYLVFKMYERDWDGYDTIDKEQLLAQFVHLWKSGHSHQLTKLEYAMVIKRNRTHFTATTTDEEMLQYLYPDDQAFMMMRDITQEFQERYSYRFTAAPHMLGTYLKKLGIVRKQKKINGRNEWGYPCSFTPPDQQATRSRLDALNLDGMF